MKKAATNLRQVLESLSEDPESPMELLASTCGRALGLCESVYLYCPDARRLITEVLGTELTVGTEYVDDMNSRTVPYHSVKV